MREVDDPRFFVTIVQRGSLAAAARAMDVTPSAVTQRLQGLEARLGVRLLDRSSRKLRLTDEGEVFLAESESIVEQYDRLIDAVRSRKSVVRGQLKILSTLGFGRKFVAPALADFHSEYPHLEVSLTLSDRWSAQDDALYDAVIHLGELVDTSQVAFALAKNERYIVASPAYLAKKPAPETPQQLSDHACLVLRENDADVTLWRFFNKRRQETSVRVHSALASNDGAVIKQWALDGKGLMIRSEWDLADDLKSGRLVRVLDQWQLPDADVSALVPERRGMTARARVFIEFFTKRFQPVPPWRR